MALFYHGCGSDDHLPHRFCPDGKDSWCWVKKAEALGVAPSSHNTKKLYLSSVKDLPTGQISGTSSQTCHSPSSLLRRCLKKQTQNPNESLHSKLWSVCLKHKHYGTECVVIAASAIVQKHNFGSHDCSLLMRMGLLSEEVLQCLKKADELSSVDAPAKPMKKRKRDEDKASTSYQGGWRLLIFRLLGLLIPSRTVLH